TETGLSSLLIGEADGVEQLLQPTEVPGLYLLPCGTRPPNPAELLASPRMAEVLDELCALADVVLLDSPPLLAVADPGILAALATGTIMVAEAGSTSIEVCAQALDILERADAKPLGMVLNRVQTKGRGGYGYGYGYGYGPYHYAYRYTDDAANGNGHRPSGNWIERTFRTGRRKVREHDDA
ncbi:MAG: CpsD/CapB family tyrosine-protein kinase, partial [Chloroflexi bacterium]|nr:CpsD/CapB family tyrosine-protein kinase [Chloroflexota bacterium]